MNLKQDFMDRLDDSLANYRRQWRQLDADDLIEMAREIAAVQDAHSYMTNEYRFDAGEARYLLSLVDPLRAIAEAWLDWMGEELDGFDAALAEVLDGEDTEYGFSLYPNDDEDDYDSDFEDDGDEDDFYGFDDDELESYSRGARFGAAAVDADFAAVAGFLCDIAVLGDKVKNFIASVE